MVSVRVSLVIRQKFQLESHPEFDIRLSNHVIADVRQLGLVFEIQRPTSDPCHHQAVIPQLDKQGRPVRALGDA